MTMTKLMTIGKTMATVNAKMTHCHIIDTIIDTIHVDINILCLT